MRLSLFALIAAIAHSPAWADQSDRHLCVEPVVFQAEQPTAPFKIHNVAISEVADNTIVSFGDLTTKNTIIGFVRGNIFMPLEGDHPKITEVDDIHETRNGERIGVFGFLGEREFWRQNPTTGEFTRMLIEKFPKEAAARTVGWSTPMDALLITRGGSRNHSGADVYALQDDAISHVEGIDEWVTKIIDFPEINMTLLGTEVENNVYLIDADRNIHNLGTFEPKDWVYINDATLLSDPYRILIDMEEAYGPFRGRFLVRLELEGGIWVPAKRQERRNVLNDFDAFSDKGLSGVNPDQLANFKGVGGRHELSVPGPGQTKIMRSRYVEVYLPASDSYVAIGNGAMRAFDRTSGEELGIMGAQVDVPKYFHSNNSVYLTDRSELLIAAKNGYFLLKDQVAGYASACQ